VVDLALVAGGLLTLAGDVAVVYAITEYRNQRRETRQTTEVPAMVERTDVTNVGGDYAVDVTFQYEVDGTAYRSSDVYSGGLSTFEAETEARALAEEYASGEQTTAFVPDDDPGSAFLRERDTGGLNLFVIAVGLVLVGVGTFLLGRGIGAI
jgi:hypothetical protein